MDEAIHRDAAMPDKTLVKQHKLTPCAQPTHGRMPQLFVCPL